MVLGPWRHGGWSQTTRRLGDVNFGEPVGDEFRRQIEAPFFAYYLKDQSGFDLANTATYQTGSERWMHYNQWPPKNVTTHDLYLDPTAHSTSPSPPTQIRSRLIPPILRIRFPIAAAPSKPLTPPAAPAGTPGSSRTKALSTDVKMSPRGKRRRSTTMSPSPATSSPTSSRQPPALTATGSSSSSMSSPTAPRRPHVMSHVFPSILARRQAGRFRADDRRRNLPRPLSHQLLAP